MNQAQVQAIADAMLKIAADGLSKEAAPLHIQRTVRQAQKADLLRRQQVSERARRLAQGKPSPASVTPEAMQQLLLSRFTHAAQPQVAPRKLKLMTRPTTRGTPIDKPLPPAAKPQIKLRPAPATQVPTPTVTALPAGAAAKDPRARLRNLSGIQAPLQPPPLPQPKRLAEPSKAWDGLSKLLSNSVGAGVGFGAGAGAAGVGLPLAWAMKDQTPVNPYLV